MLRILVHYYLSPRIIEVIPETTDITARNIYSAIRDWEDEPANLSFPTLVSAAGGEDLGGGTSVGYTVTLQNAQLMFTGRTTALDYGTGRTCDATNTKGIQLYVDDADFVSAGIYAGCTVFNTGTAEMATVTEVVDQYTLNHFPLRGTGGNGWTSGQGYMVFPNVQCNIEGGNVVAVDSNGDTISPVLQAPNVQVVRSSSASATQSDLSAIQFASFGGGVSIDTTSSSSGTEYPVGNLETPVNNLADAQTIAANNGFKTLFITGDLTLGETDDVDDYIIMGEGATINRANTTVRMINGCSTSGTRFEDCLLIGKQGGEVYGKHCVVGDGTGVDTDASQTISVVAAAGTFTRSSGDFTADGFEADMAFTAEGLASNTGIYTIDTVTPTVITIIASEWASLSDETGDGDEQLTEYRGVYNSHCEWSNCIMRGPTKLITGVWTPNHTTDSVNCRSELEWFEVDYDGSGLQQIYSDFSGRLKITNLNNASANMVIGLDSGEVWLDSTCTAGSVTINGVGTLIDESGASCTVDNTGLLNKILSDYRGTIFIDATSGNTGQVHPTGTFNEPVDNLADAMILADKYDINHLHFHSDMTITSGTDISYFVIESHSSFESEVTLDVGVIATDTIFRNIKLTGTSPSVATYEHCYLNGLQDIRGNASDCVFNGNMSTKDGASAHFHFTGCRSHSQTPAVLDIGDTMINCAGWYGMLQISGKDDAMMEANFGMTWGSLIVDNTCTAGTIFVVGGGFVTDNSNGTTVNTDYLTSNSMANAIWDEQIADHQTDGSYGHELATKADLAESVSSISYTAGSGTAVEGSETNTYTSAATRDGTYWQITEDASTGITVEMTFNHTDNDLKSGVFRIFGRYVGTPSTTHYIELWAYNYESAAWEQLQEEFMPGGMSSDAEYTHEYFESNIDRDNSNEVKIRLIHNVTTYNAGHDLYIDKAEITAIEVTTAADIASAVWSEDLSTYTTANSAGLKVYTINKIIGWLRSLL